MQCPKCNFDHAMQSGECLRCGLVFAKYGGADAAIAAPRPPEPTIEPALSPEQLAAQQTTARHELQCRVFALPAALLIGRLVASTLPMLGGFLHMWTHESGHAVTAWLCS